MRVGSFIFSVTQSYKINCITIIIKYLLHIIFLTTLRSCDCCDSSGPMMLTVKLRAVALVTQPMLQLRPNCTLLRSMDYYHQIFCRFRKCKQKVPPPSPLSTDFQKSWIFSKILVTFFFRLQGSDGGGTF